MTTKIRIKVGAVEIDYEGPEEFLNKKLPDMIGKLSSLATRVPADADSGSDGSGASGSGTATKSTLATFIKQKDAASVQTKKFLATAEWLHERGQNRVKTVDVTKALSDNKQSKLTNPSRCLRLNISSGYCEQAGREFYVTDEGRKFLG